MTFLWKSLERGLEDVVAPLDKAEVSEIELIGIGGTIAHPPLPHHRTYGSVYGGSN